MSAPGFGGVETLLLDADGNLFPSEEPAFEASTQVTNRLLAALGDPREFAAPDLRRRAMGRNFRATATDLAAETGAVIADLEQWVAEERRAVIAHLGAVLAPDPAVREPLERLARRYALAVVSSSALERLDGCFVATGLDRLLPRETRFSAEDSLPVPTSKPDPAVYLHALQELGLTAGATLAIEDAVAGVRSAVAAGITTVGNLQFVPPAERSAHAAALRDAGAASVVETWAELESLLEPARPTG